MPSGPLLVTGAAGFIGARFVASARERGCAVVSVDRASHFAERAELATVPHARIVDRDALFDWLSAERPRIGGIVHLGACTDTTELDEAYLERVNLDYSRRLWAYASREAIPMVYASSAATYGDGRFGYDDDESQIPKLQPLNPYGVSKQRFDLFALEAERQGECPPTWAGFKFFNVYGFGERHKGKMSSVVLQAFDQIREGGRVRLFRSHREGIADGEQKRDFIWVDDVVEVLHFALERPIPRGVFNLGTGEARSFLDLARATFAALGTPEEIDFVDTPAAIRDRYQYFTEARMERLRAAGFERAFTPLEQGVARYVSALRAAAGA